MLTFWRTAVFLLSTLVTTKRWLAMVANGCWRQETVLASRPSDLSPALWAFAAERFQTDDFYALFFRITVTALSISVVLFSLSGLKWRYQISKEWNFVLFSKIFHYLTHRILFSWYRVVKFSKPKTSTLSVTISTRIDSVVRCKSTTILQDINISLTLIRYEMSWSGR